MTFVKTGIMDRTLVHKTAKSVKVPYMPCTHCPYMSPCCRDSVQGAPTKSPGRRLYTPLCGTPWYPGGIPGPAPLSLSASQEQSFSRLCLSSQPLRSSLLAVFASSQPPRSSLLRGDESPSSLPGAVFNEAMSPLLASQEQSLTRR